MNNTSSTVYHGVQQQAPRTPRIKPQTGILVPISSLPFPLHSLKKRQVFDHVACPRGGNFWPSAATTMGRMWRRRGSGDVLGVTRRVLGEEHPDALTTANNLASSISRQGKYTDAERMEREVLCVMRRVLEEDHPVC